MAELTGWVLKKTLPVVTNCDNMHVWQLSNAVPLGDWLLAPCSDIPLSPDTDQTIPYPILLMLNTRFGSDKYQMAKTSVWQGPDSNRWPVQEAVPHCQRPAAMVTESRPLRRRPGTRRQTSRRRDAGACVLSHTGPRDPGAIWQCQWTRAVVDLSPLTYFWPALEGQQTYLWCWTAHIWVAPEQHFSPPTVLYGISTWWLTSELVIDRHSGTQDQVANLRLWRWSLGLWRASITPMSHVYLNSGYHSTDPMKASGFIL